MAISNPMAVYNAENNIEAQILCIFLEQKGIEAYATLDESIVGLWAFGMLPEIHKAQIWVEKSNVEAVVPLLAEYERERSRRLSRESAEELRDGSIEVVCEDCGKASRFAASKRGTVQDCNHCGAYVDVEDGLDTTESWEAED